MGEQVCGSVVARPKLGAASTGVYTINVHHVRASSDDAVTTWLREVRPAVLAAGVTITGVLRTEPATNTFPRLPVRDADVLVVITRHDSHAAREAGADLVGEASQTIERFEQAPRETLVLEPTARSSLR